MESTFIPATVVRNPTVRFGSPRVNEQKRLQPSCKWGLTGHNIGHHNICEAYARSSSVSGTSTNKAHKKRMCCTINQIINLYTACFFICSFVSHNPVLFLFSPFSSIWSSSQTKTHTERDREGWGNIKSTVPISETMRVSREVIFRQNSLVGLISVL